MHDKPEGSSQASLIWLWSWDVPRELGANTDNIMMMMIAIIIIMVMKKIIWMMMMMIKMIMMMLMMLMINLAHEAIEGAGAVVGRFKTAAICHQLHHLIMIMIMMTMTTMTMMAVISIKFL